MEYHINQLDEAIVYYLTLNANIAIHYTKIYFDLRDEGTCRDLYDIKHNDRFMSCCYTLDLLHDNIHKFYRNGELFLMFSRNHVKGSEPIYNKDNWSNVFDYPGSFAIIECIANTPKYAKVFKFDQLTPSINGIDTPLHIICRNGMIELLKKILSYGSDIDIEVRNFNDVSLLRMVENNGKILKILLDYKHKKSLDLIIEQNKKLNKVNNEHDRSLKILMKQNKDLTDCLGSTQDECRIYKQKIKRLEFLGYAMTGIFILFSLIGVR